MGKTYWRSIKIFLYILLWELDKHVQEQISGCRTETIFQKGM